MNSKNNYKKYSSLISNILLVTILLYPVLFSFTHVLTHHHSAHFHSHECKQEVYSNTKTANSIAISYSESREKCPICAYEYAHGIESIRLSLQNEITQLTSYNFPISESILIKEYCNLRAPRAPPSC